MYNEENFKSQYGQDRELLSLIGRKTNGFFVELGAGDGINISNSYFFEKELDWTGVLIEPNPVSFLELQKNRNNCFIFNELCDSEANIEHDFLLAGLVGGIISSESGYWIKKHIENEIIKLKTTTLENILDRCNSPKNIDFLSLDVEGYEYNILKTFPFDKYSFDYICVEHNSCFDGDTNKQRIRKILIENGYEVIKELYLDDIFMNSKIKK